MYSLLAAISKSELHKRVVDCIHRSLVGIKGLAFSPFLAVYTCSKQLGPNATPTTMSLDSTAKFTRSWLTECLESHSLCRQPAEMATVWAIGSLHQVRDLGRKDRMPRRLLAVGSESIRLEDISPTQEIRPYVALSHRWGTNETCKTTAGSSREWRLTELPKTYRDAIDVTRNLGNDFLWIDSLCIVQDDPEDWKVEAPRMSIVYGNAICHIMAMDAEDSHGGLFSGSGNLNSRGWVVQELMLAPRTLVYTQGGVQWECRESAAGAPHKKLFQSLRDTLSEPQEDLDAYFDMDEGGGSGGEDHVPFLRAWWRFLEVYTPCQLSHGSDKFLAINGIGSTLQRRSRLRNTWGLWRDFLAYELLWSVEGPVAQRPARFRAPTWSWASTDNGRVVNEYYKRSEEPQFMIEPEIVVPVNTSFDQELPMPAWTSENYSITLKGDLREADLRVSVEEDLTQRYTIELETTGRFSDAEEHDFRPDTRLQPGNHKVLCVLFLHYRDGEYIDVRLVVQSSRSDRIVRRLGYLETRYKEMRDSSEVDEDLWWKEIVLR